MLRRLAILPLFLLTLPACDSLGSDAIGITGTWEGEVFEADTPQTRYPLQLRLQDTGQFVSGTGSVELPGDLFEFSLNKGSFLNGIVNLDIRFDDPPFQGAIDGTLTQESPAQIEGTFAGRGLVGNARFEIELVDR